MAQSSFGGFIQPRPDKSGVNTGDATATAADMLAGKTAYAKGRKITGLGDANLVPDNIKNGVSIFSVAGTVVAIGPGDTIVNTNAAVKSSTSTTAVKLKETQVSNAGAYRVKFTLATTTTNTVNGQIYVNGSPAGTLRSVNNGAITFSEDITINANDLIQIYGYCPLGTNLNISDFQICINTITFTNTLV